MLSVIVPTYCEVENIGPLLERLAAVRPRCGEPLEVLIMDSASPDGTAERAGRLLTQWDLGRVVQFSAPRGLAEAVCEGARLAQGDVVAVMDADLSHPPELLPQLLTAVRSGYEIAVASRYVPGGGTVNWTRRRQWLSRLANLMAQPLMRVADATSGYFLTTAQRVSALAVVPGGYKILLDVMVQGDVRKIQEIPYHFVDRVRGASKLRLGVQWSYLRQLMRLYGVRWRRRGSSPSSTGANEARPA